MKHLNIKTYDAGHVYPENYDIIRNNHFYIVKKYARFFFNFIRS